MYRIPSAAAYRAFLRSCGYIVDDVDVLYHRARTQDAAFLIWLERIDDGARVLRWLGHSAQRLFIRTPTAAELRGYRRGLIKRAAESKSAA